MKKKLFALLLAFSILCAVQIPAFAASGSLSVSSSNTNPAAGDEVTLTVSMSGTENATSMALTFQYDTNAIEIKSGEWLKTGSVLADFDKANNAAWCHCEKFRCQREHRRYWKTCCEKWRYIHFLYTGKHSIKSDLQNSSLWKLGKSKR